jgi:general secretion pathway protein M
MRGWLATLSVRERLSLLLGGLALAATLGYVLLWQPFAARHARLAEVVAEQGQLVQWMRDTAAELAALGQRGPVPGAMGARDQSLLTVVDATTRAAGLAGQVTRVQPEGADTVRVWLDRVRFNQLVSWLARLEAEAGVEIDSANLEPTDRPGEVNARLSLKRAGGGAS